MCRAKNSPDFRSFGPYFAPKNAPNLPVFLSLRRFGGTIRALFAGKHKPLNSEECQTPQPPLLLKKYRNTPPICIAIRLPFVSQYFWENLGGCGHRDVPYYPQQICAKISQKFSGEQAGSVLGGSAISNQQGCAIWGRERSKTCRFHLQGFNKARILVLDA